MNASSEGSGESVHMHRLVRAFVARQFDKYQKSHAKCNAFVQSIRLPAQQAKQSFEIKLLLMKSVERLSLLWDYWLA